MLRILHMISDTNIGGAGRHLLSFLEHYDRAKLEVRVLCPAGSLLVERCAKAGVETHTSPYFAGDRSLGWRGLAGLLREVSSIIKGNKIDVVHTHAAFSGRLAAIAAGAPCVVYTKHRMDWEVSGGSLKRMVAGFLNRITCRRVIAVSRAVQESLVSSGMPREKIELIYNGIDLEQFREQSREGDPASRSEFGEGRLVGMVARVEPEKGHRYFLEAAARVLERRKDVFFVVVGTGSLLGEMKEVARRCGIGERVIFTGFRENVAQLIAMMDIMVIPSLTEAFGISMIEGMCLAKACVASAVGGLAEIAGEDGRIAFLVPPADAIALAGKIDFLLENPDVAADMGARAAAEVEKGFSAKVMAGKLTDLYYSLMESK